MKNKLIFFICIFLSFGFISNAKASTLHMYYDSDYVNQIISNNPIDDINNTLIPFIEENMDDYLVSVMPRYSVLNNTPSSVRINIAQKITNTIPVYSIFLQENTLSNIRLYQVNSIDGDNYGQNANAYSSVIWFYEFSSNDTANTGSITNLINKLRYFLDNPTFDSPSSATIVEIDPPVNNISNFLLQPEYAREGLPYYANYEPRIIRWSNLPNAPYWSDLIVHYNEQTLSYEFGSIFPFYKDFITANTYLPPTVSDLGDGQLGYTANQIVIGDTQSVSPVRCPQNTDFINDFCYTNQHNYIDEEHLLNGALNVQFDLMNRPRFTQNNYYILTYRVHSSVNYLPSVASISSGQTSMPIQIIKTNIVNNGIYKDIQVVLKATQSFGNEEPYALSTISLRFPNISTSEPDTSDFYYGIYKTYKFTVSGTEPPTQTQLDNDYHNNDIDSVSNNDNNTSWFNKFHINDRGLSTVLTAPVTLFQRMRNTNCTNIVVPVPYLGNFSLPCISAIFSENLPTVFNLYQTIISGLICYYVGLGYFRIIKNSFTPDNDRIEVQDL